MFASGNKAVKTKQGRVQVFPATKTLLVPGRWKGIDLKDIQDIDLEEGSALSKRITVTRLALFGILALGMPKTRGGEKFLTITTKDDLMAFQVDHKKVPDAQRLVHAVRKAMR